MTEPAPRMHECPGKHCKRQVPQRQLACRSHWFALPGEIRADVDNTYRQYGRLSPPHLAAMAAALEWYRHHG